VDTAKYDNAPAETKGVRNGNAGGFKKGGATKKHFATGGSVNSTGSAVAMPQGRKPIPKPVAINELAGAYKKGGKVAPGNRALQAVFDKENAPAMSAAKAMSNEKYGPASTMKLKRGGKAC
jgi:beta-glucosidase-like glycosyl hydrolase